MCKQDYVSSQLQVDHIEGGDISLKEVEDFQTAFEALILVSSEDLRFLCKDCNTTATYAKRFNLSYREAACKRFIIQVVKDKGLEEFFKSRGIDPPKGVARSKEIAYEILLRETNES